MIVDIKNLKYLSLLRKCLAFIHYESAEGKTIIDIKNRIGPKTNKVIDWLLNGQYIKEESKRYKIKEPVDNTLMLIRDIDLELYQYKQTKLQAKLTNYNWWLMIATIIMAIATCIIVLFEIFAI